MENIPILKVKYYIFVVFCLLLQYYPDSPQLGACPTPVDRKCWLQMLETSWLLQRLQHPALMVPAWMGRLSNAPREALQCTAGFSQSQSGRELAKLHLDITPLLCRQTGCSYIPKPPLLFMVKTAHIFLAQSFKGFAFENPAPKLTHVQGIM